MSLKEPSFTIGIEEEYLLVDSATMDLVNDPPKTIMEECQRLARWQVTPELLRSQIEVGTKVCKTIAEAREDLARLRGIVVNVAGKEGLSPIAASTHPFGRWLEQMHWQTVKSRRRTCAGKRQGRKDE